MSKRIGPFIYSGEHIKTVKYPSGDIYTFVLYSAYNAMGLVGKENNGIAVLDENNKAVVCDKIMCSESTDRKIETFHKLINLDFNDMYSFISENGEMR